MFNNVDSTKLKEVIGGYKMRQLLHRSTWAGMLFSIVTYSVGQVTQGALQERAPQGLTPSQAQSMIMGPGDVATINVSNSSDFAMKVRVEASGDVILPYLGRQHFGGRSVEQIQQSLVQQLKDQQYFSDPQVSIFVEQFTSQTISVFGEVNKGGVFPGIGDHTLGELLSDAQGLTPFASPHILIHRRDQVDAIQVDLGSPEASKTPVYAGDVIRVPKSGLVYVVGAVKTPNAFPLPTGPDITVIQALAFAGGPLRTAKRGQIHAVRTVNDAEGDIPDNYAQVVSGKAPDPLVHPGDIVYVPDSYARIIAAGSGGVIGSAIIAAAYLQQ